MINKREILLKNFAAKASFCLLGLSLYPSTFADQMDAIATNAVLIDSQGVLTALSNPQSNQIPNNVVIGGKSYGVVGSSANMHTNEVLLFLDQPVLGIEPIQRYRDNIGQRLQDNSRVYTFTPKLNPTNSIDFSKQKQIIFRDMKCESVQGTTPQQPFTYQVMKYIETPPSDTQLGVGYFIRNNNQLELIGLNTLLNNVPMSLTHGITTNTILDNAIIQNALKAPSEYHEGSPAPSAPHIPAPTPSQPYIPQPQLPYVPTSQPYYVPTQPYYVPTQPYYVPTPYVYPPYPPVIPMPTFPSVIPAPTGGQPSTAPLPQVQIDPAKEDLAVGSLVGLACGDALGLPYEQARTFNAVTTIPPLNMKASKHYGEGDWSDDTSMALAMAESLIQKRKFKARDVKNRFVDWYRHGTYDSQGKKANGSGHNTRTELENYRQRQSGVFASPSNNAGNGAIMRECPVVIFYNHDYKKALRFAVNQTRLTHSSPAAEEASAMLADILFRAFSYDTNKDKERKQGETDADARKRIALNLINYRTRRTAVLPKLDQNIGPDQKYVLTLAGKDDSNANWRNIDKQTFINKLKANAAQRNDNSFAARGARDTLAIALWSVQHTNSFEQAMIEAISMGGDTDTIGAVTGQIAGAIYGYNAIPGKWKNKLRTDKYDIAQIAQDLYEIAEKVHAASSQGH